MIKHAKDCSQRHLKKDCSHALISENECLLLLSRLETRTKRVSDLFLTVNLIWVHPSKRSLGGNTARHVVSHLLAYLGDCNFTKTIVGLSGMNVYYHANLYSSGRGTLSTVIKENLAYMKECGAWKIKDLDLEAGVLRVDS